MARMALRTATGRFGHDTARLSSSGGSQTAVALDESDAVKHNARNDHLGLTIVYDFMDSEHTYEPDFLVRLNLANAV